MTININLLPWRELKRAQQRQQFFTLLALAGLLGIIISIFIPWQLSNSIKKVGKESALLHQRSTLLMTQAEKLEKIEKPAKKVSNQLQYFQTIIQSRYLPIQLLNIITQAVPNAVQLTQLEKKGNQLILRGETNSTQAISQLLSKLNQSSLLQQAKLREIKTIDNQGNDFTLVATLNKQPQANNNGQ